MILLVALAAGLVIGLASSWWRGTPYCPPALQTVWLAFVAFLPQFLFLYLLHLPFLSQQIRNRFAATSLVVSMLVFLGFAWLNRRAPGMSILLFGLILNLLVIATNGGFMPIGPQTASQLISKDSTLDLQPGTRFGTKDILQLPEQTRFEWLADRFLPPAWISYRFAFSLGDIFIAMGVFGMLAYQKPVPNSDGGT